MNRQLKIAIAVGLFFLAAPVKVRAQAQSPAGAQRPAAAKLSDADLDHLVAPVALYPDALLAHVLPAATAPLDVVQAARYLHQHDGKVDTTPDNNWNTSVKVLMRFPDVLNKLDTDLDWTTALGHAVTSQMQDLMKSIQRVRAEAQAAGNLASNDKQIVVTQQGAIQIQPADPTVVYVPTYNPSTVIVQQDTSAAYGAVGFAAGIAVGAALADDHCDWYGGAIYHGAYYRGAYPYPTPYHNLNDYWNGMAARPYDPRGVADPRGPYDPRGVADPRGRYDPRGPYDPRGAYDPRGKYDPRAARATPYSSAGYGRAGVGGQAGLGGGAAGQAGLGGGAAGVGRPGAGGQAGLGGGAAGRGYGGERAGSRQGGSRQSAFGERQGGYSQTRSAGDRGRQSISQSRSSSYGRSSGYSGNRSGGSSVFNRGGGSGGRSSGFGGGGGGRRGGRR